MLLLLYFCKNAKRVHQVYYTLISTLFWRNKGILLATQNLREINFRNLKMAVLTNSKVLKNWLMHNFSLLEMHKFTENQNSEPLSLSKLHFFEILNSLEFISCKIWVAEKLWYFHTNQNLPTYLRKSRKRKLTTCPQRLEFRWIPTKKALWSNHVVWERLSF